GGGEQNVDLGGGGGGGGKQPVLEGVRVTAGTAPHSLLIYASTDNYRIIEQTLRQLQQPQIQVRIDGTGARDTLNNSLSYGVQFFLQSQQIGLPADRGSALNLPSSPPSVAPTVTNGIPITPFLTRAFPGFNLLIGSELDPHLILDALHGITDV